ncbi:MAG: glycosyltransferase [Candidatus Levybacteria bacterium]|nr:glycosyltransferase [Candidatus Levybacteria bacterium]
MFNNIAIIIPCYNASKTIINAIKGVLIYSPKSKVIIVDDNSPDKSAELIKKCFLYDKRIKLVIRKSKGGRGSAVLRGFQEGLRDKNIEFFIEMDADLCHDPKYIPVLIEKCRKYDVTIASKYLKKSKIFGLNKRREAFSRLVNFYIKLMLGIPITDYTNGYRCYRRKALERINLNFFYSKGFIVLSEIIYRIHKKGGSFFEIPFNFTFNQKNKSNFSFSEIKEAFVTILKLKYYFR